jgi:predicted  nucleic acid-binding Zn-ribbon protein
MQEAIAALDKEINRLKAGITHMMRQLAEVTEEAENLKSNIAADSEKISQLTKAIDKLGNDALAASITGPAEKRYEKIPE